MRGDVFGLTGPRRFWLPFLPVLLAFAGLTAVAIIRPWLPAGYGVVFFGATVVTAVIQGVFLSMGRPKARALQTQALQLQAVYEVLSKAGGSLDLQEVLDAITRLTVEVTGVRGCSIKLLDEAGRTAGKGAQGAKMHVRSLAGIRREVSELSVDAAENIYARSLLDGRPVRVEDAQAIDFPELDGEVESLVCVPLRRGAQVVGALCLYGEKGKSLPSETMSFLSRLGDLATIFIENASVYESLKKIDGAKTWFLLKASHELKSPLASIQSMCETILEGYLGGLSDRQREMIDRIRIRSSLLRATSNDLLALAKLKSPVPGEERERVELSAELGETTAFFQAEAERKQVRLTLSVPKDPLAVIATREGVRSVVSNLVSNAIKYSPNGTAVSIRLEPAPGGARIRVEDQGIGIPAEEKAKLFSEFFRAANARSFTEAGTGLGLAIVKSIMDGFGGSVAIESEEGKGTTVDLWFAGDA
jgi:K+-sensing histidine kinase KdpD